MWDWLRIEGQIEEHARDVPGDADPVRVARAVFALVAHRALQPPQTRVTDWVDRHVVIDGLDDLDDETADAAAELLRASGLRRRLETSVRKRMTRHSSGLFLLASVPFRGTRVSVGLTPDGVSFLVRQEKLAAARPGRRPGGLGDLVEVDLSPVTDEREAVQPTHSATFAVTGVNVSYGVTPDGRTCVVRLEDEGDLEPRTWQAVLVRPDIVVDEALVKSLAAQIRLTEALDRQLRHPLREPFIPDDIGSKAHLTADWLALLLQSLAEWHLKRPWPVAAAQMSTARRVTCQVGDEEIDVPTPPTDVQEEIRRALPTVTGEA